MDPLVGAQSCFDLAEVHYILEIVHPEFADFSKPVVKLFVILNASEATQNNSG